MQLLGLSLMPNVVGIDIGCGMLMAKLKDKRIPESVKPNAKNGSEPKKRRGESEKDIM